MTFMIVKNIPSTHLTDLVLILRQAGVNIGDKFHSRQFLAQFRGIACRVIRKENQRKFSTPPASSLKCNILADFFTRLNSSCIIRTGNDPWLPSLPLI